MVTGNSLYTVYLFSSVIFAVRTALWFSSVLDILPSAVTAFVFEDVHSTVALSKPAIVCGRVKSSVILFWFGAILAIAAAAFSAYDSV